MVVTFGEQPPVYANSRSDTQMNTSPYPIQRKNNIYFSYEYARCYEL